MVSPSIYIAENYIYKDKSYTGSFPVFMREACFVPQPLGIRASINPADLDEDLLKIAPEETTINAPQVISTETGQALLYIYN